MTMMIAEKKKTCLLLRSHEIDMSACKVKQRLENVPIDKFPDVVSAKLFAANSRMPWP